MVTVLFNPCSKELNRSPYDGPRGVLGLASAVGHPHGVTRRTRCRCDPGRASGVCWPTRGYRHDRNDEPGASEPLPRNRRPDFIVRIDDGHGEEDPPNLIIEVTGEPKKEKEARTATARTLWVTAVNNRGASGGGLSWKSLTRMMM